MALGLISILKAYLTFTIIILLLYAIRHTVFSFNRMYGKQRLYYSDIYDSDLPFISVLIPMYNEEKVVNRLMQALIDSDYPKDKMEIIAIDDNSTDRTGEIIDRYSAEYEFIHSIHRDSKYRGKPAALNDGMEIAKGEIVIIFDADYFPSRGLLKQLAIGFNNPEVGAVMGRVIPINTNTNLLTKLLSIERSAGYQVDQQARYNMKLIPQYGGTVGGFRKKLIMDTGGFNVRVLAEDTELTYRLYTMGYKVVYANGAECYEESPETWQARGRQVRRWSRGHNLVSFLYFFKVICSKNMTFREKVDGIFLLMIYTVPLIFFLAFIDSVILFFLGEINLFIGWWILLFITAYNSYGNFATFHEIGTAMIMDGNYKDIIYLSLMTFVYYFYLWNLSLGFFEALIDFISFRRVNWDKTERFSDVEGEGSEG